MNARITQALNVYLTQRGAVPAMLGIGVLLAVLLYVVADFRGNALEYPMLLTNTIGLPAMFASFWVVSIGKWQFVNPRARLLPGFARPHLAVALGWLALVLIVYPYCVATLLLETDPVATLAYALACGAASTWGMHLQRPLVPFVGFAVLMSPLAPGLHPFWEVGGDASENVAWVVARWMCLLAGFLAIALWLDQLRSLTEESDAYCIPTQAQSGKASRMEKSEARRNIARQLSKSGIATWLIDRWHDQLATRRAQNLGDRQRLLRYGLAPVPVGARAVGLVAMMAMICLVNALMISPAGSASWAAVMPIAATFTMFGPLIGFQMLAMRKPRMQAELMFPLDRNAYVGGLFRAMFRESVITWAMASYALLVCCAVFSPELLLPGRTLAVLLATFTGTIASSTCMMPVALIDSGLKRTVLMMVLIYAIIAILGGGAALYHFLSPTYGIVAVMFLLVASLALLPRVYRVWLRAEFG